MRLDTILIDPAENNSYNFSSAGVPLMIYRKNQNFVPRKIAGELILIPLQKQIDQIKSIYGLNPIACSVWDLIDGVKDMDQIRTALQAEYDVESSILEKDLVGLIGQLEEIQAIQPVS